MNRVYNKYDGVIYIIKPDEYVGNEKDKNKFKIGLSYKNGTPRVKGFGSKTIVYGVHLIKNVFDVESTLKSKFKNLFILIKGTEYFEGDLGSMINIYWSIVHPNLILKNHNPKPNKNLPIDVDKHTINLKILKLKQDPCLTDKFFCENCEYSTDRKYRYERHITNKNGCKHIITIPCRYCKKTFVTNIVCQKHQTKCPNKKNRICKYCNKQYSRVSGLHEHFQTCKKNPLNYIKQNDKLDYKCCYCDLFFTKVDLQKHVGICNSANNASNNINSNIDNSTTINNKITNNVAILNFGNEDLSHITAQKLQQCFLDPKNSISKLIEMIHYDTTHPENNNFKIDNQNSKHVKFRSGSSWKYKKMNPALDQIANKNFGILEKRVGECIDDMSLSAKDKWDNFCHDYRNNKPIVIEYVYKGIVILLKKHVVPIKASS